MDGRFSAQNENDAEENQDRAGHQPQQPIPLCKSICDFFKKYLCCGWCFGEFNIENQQPGANPAAEPRLIPIWKLLLMCLLRRYCLLLRCCFECFGEHWDDDESFGIRTAEREELMEVEMQDRNS